MRKILLVGSGGREHAIGEAVKCSSQPTYLVTFGNTANIGLKSFSDQYYVGDILDKNAVFEIAKKEEIEFAIIGPEAPIEAGVSDILIENGIPCIAPSSNTGKIETSKSFTRNLLNKYHIPGNAIYKHFTSDFRMKEFIENNLGGNFVVKADGLKSGKGVFVMGDHFSTIDEGIKLAKDFLAKDGKIVIEEKFVGQEFSLMFFTDGKTLAKMPIVQDNKRAFEDDKGPNTGGMGSYSMSDHLLPFVNESDLKFATDISKKVLDAIAKECGEYYKGVLYGSFIKTRNGIRLIEYNARFGDPEALNVIPLLKTDFIKICDAIINGQLHVVPVKFANFATVCKYLVPEGYPDKPVKDVEVEFDEIDRAIKVYFAGVEKREEKIYLTGSRAIAMVGAHPKLDKAELLAEEGCWRVKGPVFYRKDIGRREYLEKKVEMMENLMK